MSFLTDRYKTDFFSKIFTETKGVHYNETHSVEQFENSTTFKKFATVVPRLNGEITAMTIDLKYLYSGKEQNEITVQIRDSNGRVLTEEKSPASSDVFFNEVPIFSAFEKIELYFKNKYEISGKYTTTVPESITLHYFVQEKPDYFFVKSE